MRGMHQPPRIPDTCMLLSALTLLVLLAGTTLLWAGPGAGSAAGNDADAGAPAWNGSDSERYVVLAWSDLGTDDRDPSGDTDDTRRPAGAVWAQVVERGEPPRIVTEGLTVEYATTSPTRPMDGAEGSEAGQARLEDGDRQASGSLSGRMVSDGDLFRVSELPIQTADGNGPASLYQIVEVIVRDSSTNEILAMTRVVMPTSLEASRAIDGYLAALAGTPAEEPAVGNGTQATVLAAPAAQDGGTLQAGQTLPPAPRKTPRKPVRKALPRIAQDRPTAMPGQPAALDVPPARARLPVMVSGGMPARDGGNLLGAQASQARVALPSGSASLAPRPEDMPTTPSRRASGLASMASNGSFGQIPMHGGLSLPARDRIPRAAPPVADGRRASQAGRHWSVSTDVSNCATCHASAGQAKRIQAPRAPAAAQGGAPDDPAAACCACHAAVGEPARQLRARERSVRLEGPAPPWAARIGVAGPPGTGGVRRGCG